MDQEGAGVDDFQASGDMVRVVNKGRAESAVVVSPTSDCAAPAVAEQHGALLGAARATGGDSAMRAIALQPAATGALAAEQGSFLCVQGQQVGYPVKSGATYNLVDGIIIEYEDARQEGGQ